MFARSTLAVALFCAAVSAQSSSNTNTTIEPSSVTLTLRNQWCQAQTNTCGTLCSGDYGNNTCSPDTLTFSCTCTSNNSAPGLQYYTQTLPTFICEQVFTNCNQANVGDAAAQALCLSNERKNCGHNDPASFVAAAVSSSTSAAASATGAAASSATGSATSTSSSKAAGATVAAMRNFGTGAMALGVGAAFGYML